jgi:DNA-binding FadR family transcriptional regulator
MAEELLHQHLDIVLAVETRDPDKAKDGMIRHLEIASSRLTTSVSFGVPCCRSASRSA